MHHNSNHNSSHYSNHHHHCSSSSSSSRQSRARVHHHRHHNSSGRRQSRARVHHHRHHSSHYSSNNSKRHRHSSVGSSTRLPNKTSNRSRLKTLSHHHHHHHHHHHQHHRHSNSNNSNSCCEACSATGIGPGTTVLVQSTRRATTSRHDSDPGCSTVHRPACSPTHQPTHSSANNISRPALSTSKLTLPLDFQAWTFFCRPIRHGLVTSFLQSTGGCLTCPLTKIGATTTSALLAATEPIASHLLPNTIACTHTRAAAVGFEPCAHITFFSFSLCCFLLQ